MKKLLNVVLVSLLAQSALAANTLHCVIEKYEQVNQGEVTTLCGTFDFTSPDPVKGTIQTSKGVGACPELALGLFRALPNLEAIRFVMGNYDPTYKGPLAFTRNSASVIFYQQIPDKFAIDFTATAHPMDPTYRARCELK